MIPRRLHRIWFGQRPRPPAYDVFWDNWRSSHPGWTLITWTEGNLPPIINRNVYDDVMVTARSAGIPMDTARALAVQRADIVAYELVWRYGGVYINCDMQPLRSLEPLLKHGAFVGKEDDHFLCNAVMGSTPGHPFFTRCVEGLSEWYSDHRMDGMEVSTGPRYLTHVAEMGSTGLTVLPQSAFYYAHHGSIPRGGDASAYEDGARASGAYALHHWGHCTQEGEVRE